MKKLLAIPLLAAALSVPAPAQCVMCYLSAKSQNAARARVLAQTAPLQLERVLLALDARELGSELVPGALESLGSVRGERRRPAPEGLTARRARQRLK